MKFSVDERGFKQESEEEIKTFSIIVSGSDGKLMSFEWKKILSKTLSAFSLSTFQLFTGEFVRGKSLALISLKLWS